LSNADILLEDLNERDPMRADLQEISEASLRAADLTRQLLMFSRQQIVAPKVLDLNQVLVQFDKMLRRLVGEDIGPAQALVEAVLPRRTCLSRCAAGSGIDEQPLAANVDLVFLVCGLDGDFNLRRLERYLALTAGSGASAVIVLNKADLCSDLAGRMVETAAIARSTPVVAASAVDPCGLDDLRRFLTKGSTVALLGSSGAGKSTIANRLLGEERFRTAEVRKGDSRGRHTTVRRELTPLPCTGALIDTPGLRELQLWTGRESVDAVFDDVAAVAEGCRFRDCTHSGEPGCAVAAALDRGEVDSGRWASFRKLRAEAEWHESMADPLSALERKRKWKSIRKQARAISKSRH
jgi:ribosome biogenesis GTPase